MAATLANDVDEAHAELERAGLHLVRAVVKRRASRGMLLAAKRHLETSLAAVNRALEKMP